MAVDMCSFYLNFIPWNGRRSLPLSILQPHQADLRILRFFKRSWVLHLLRWGLCVTPQLQSTSHWMHSLPKRWCSVLERGSDNSWNPGRYGLQSAWVPEGTFLWNDRIPPQFSAITNCEIWMALPSSYCKILQIPHVSSKIVSIFCYFLKKQDWEDLHFVVVEWTCSIGVFPLQPTETRHQGHKMYFVTELVRQRRGWWQVCFCYRKCCWGVTHKELEKFRKSNIDKWYFSCGVFLLQPLAINCLFGNCPIYFLPCVRFVCKFKTRIVHEYDNPLVWLCFQCHVSHAIYQMNGFCDEIEVQNHEIEASLHNASISSVSFNCRSLWWALDIEIYHLERFLAPKKWTLFEPGDKKWMLFSHDDDDDDDDEDEDDILEYYTCNWSTAGVWWFQTWQSLLRDTSCSCSEFLCFCLFYNGVSLFQCYHSGCATMRPLVTWPLHSISCIRSASVISGYQCCWSNKTPRHMLQEAVR